MLRQKQARSRRQLMRAELGETVDHALRTAGHAAGGMRATMGPRVAPAAERVRSAAAGGWGSTKAALAPLNEAAQAELRQARRQAQRQAKRAQEQAQRRTKRQQRRWPRMVGLLAGGVAVGAAAAYVLRQRRQQEWEEYDPTDVMEATEPPEAGLASSPAAGTSPAPGTSPAAGRSPASTPDGVTATERPSSSTVDAASEDRRV